jgi:ribosomal protein S1
MTEEVLETVEKTTEEVGAAAVKRKDRLEGVVSKITLGGAVIDLGLEKFGFIHLTQLGEKEVKSVQDVLSEGQNVQVWVRRVNSKQDFIELTMVEPLALEWRDIRKGMAVKGTVTRIERFGAFVEIGAERPGLVHVSELTHDYVRTPEEIVKVGEEVEAQVLDVNRRKKQIKLSMKALVEKPAAILKNLNKQTAFESDFEDDKPVPTAMEIALREAMEKTKSDETDRKKRNRSGNQELEDILNRTLDGYSGE